ncbi:MAG: caspase family protein [Isosphaeraceae bacterium]
MLVSGGDDGAVRFWGLQPDGKVSKPLIGTLAVWPGESSGSGESAIPRDWIAYTPRGAFDGTPGGARFLRRVGNRVDAVDQQELDQVRFPNLVQRFTEGQSPAPNGPPPKKPPALSIAEQSRPDRGSAIIRVVYDPEVSDLRLYQNGVPVPMADAARRLIDRPNPAGQMSVRVRLRQGVNQFYAMAAPRQLGTLEGRSDPIELRSEIPEEEPRIHLLALGVGNYDRRKLQYAAADARGLVDHFTRLVAQNQQEAGKVDLFLDDAVTLAAVRNWFGEVRKVVEDRPQDRVVVYLAGHTEVIQRTQQFALLPVTYPFRSDWPEIVSRRGPADEPVPKDQEAHVLAFSTILFDLVRLQALDRVVIVDACQAESIYSDPAVSQIRRIVDRDAWPGRVAYMLATRKGEAALEEKKLEHGLMTYVLLRGTGAKVPDPPEAAEAFSDAPTADLDGDREITIQELQVFIDRKLPVLLRRFEGERERGPSAPAAPRSASETRPPPVSFPLIRIP